MAGKFLLQDLGTQFCTSFLCSYNYTTNSFEFRIIKIFFLDLSCLAACLGWNQACLEL